MDDGAGVFGVAVDLEVASTSFIAHEFGPEYHQERGVSHPALTMRNLCDLGNQAGVGDDAEAPGLLVAARRGKAPCFQDIIQDECGDGCGRKPAVTGTGVERFSHFSHNLMRRAQTRKLPH